ASPRSASACIEPLSRNAGEGMIGDVDTGAAPAFASCITATVRHQGRHAMKSAYGREVPPPDHELTSVEPGSPMGELLRRYWQPVCLSEELKDLPRKEKLLGEEIVLFRDKQDRVGALDPHCAHRGTSLEWGQIEERGIRCRYHGWLYDTQGQC